MVVAGRAPGAASRLTVLIADDDPYVRAELEHFVSRRGCHAFFVPDGTAALRCLTLSRDASKGFGRIDVVIADTDLPGRSGLDLLMAARGNHWDLEVVLTAASISSVLRRELLRLGVTAVLGKPVSLPELDSVLVRIGDKRTG
jgi:CheY-like chemotaxis protein